MPPRCTPQRFLAVLGAVIAFALAVGACGSDSTSASSGGAGAAPVTVRLGYFPNVTHAPAIVAVEGGLYQQRLGANKLETKTFNAGPEAVEALFSGAIDAAYVGPNPAINAYQKSNGQAIRIVAGSTSGGASLVVKPEINSAAGLKGKTLASPQLGGTQDVALRSYLKMNGLNTDTNGGGDVSIKPQANADTLTQFQQGQIDGAWVPEPWATRLVQEGGGKTLVDERTLWPGGQFVTTHLIVATKFLKDHVDVVKDLIEAEADAVKKLSDDPTGSQQLVNQGIAKITGKALKDSLITASFANLSFTLDPLASTLAKSASDAESIGLLDKVDLKGIYDLTALNSVLAARGEASVKGL
jgi:NitT/TauT family transport system substrate-binding protein